MIFQAGEQPTNSFKISGILALMVDAVRALSLDQLRKRKSVKWRQFPNDVLPLPVAEMDFASAPAIKAALLDMVERSDTGYLGPFPELFDAFAKFSNLVGVGRLIPNKCE